MTPRRLVLVGLITAFVIADLAPRAQLRPVTELGGRTALELMLRRLNTTGILMMATAHPDDENSALLAMLTSGRGVRAVVASATRGSGGQNEIGPELFEALAVLRTEELAAVHRWDGAEQYFARAVDFGYSFSVEETFEKWGRREILGDYVRLIRMTRPDVITGMRPDGTGGGQHHQASALLAREAFRAAGDASQFPEQLKEGLRPWQSSKFYYTGAFGFGGEPPPPGGRRLVSIDVGVYDPVLGCTYSDIGTEARSMHKCQGMAQLLALPGPAVSRYYLEDTTIPGQTDKDETSLFDGVDITIAGLARFAGAQPPQALTAGLATIQSQVNTAATKLTEQGTEAAGPALLAGLAAVRKLRADLESIGLDAVARVEIDYRLMDKEQDFQEAALLAYGVRIETLADDGLVTPGQGVKGSIYVANRGGTNIAIKRIAFAGFDGQPAGCEPGPVTSGAVYRCAPALRIASDAKRTALYWSRPGEAGRYVFESDAPFGLPFRPTPFRASFEIELPGGVVTTEQPFQYRYAGNIFSGEKRMELHVVPAFAVQVKPTVAIVPEEAVRRPANAGSSVSREVRVTVTNDTNGAATGMVSLEPSSGWTVSPASAPVKFTREDEAITVRFTVGPTPQVKAGVYTVKAVATMDKGSGERFDLGYQVIEYPHIHRRHIYEDAQTSLKVIDVKTAPNLRVGYVMGVGDEVPAAIEQLGARLEFIDADMLSWGDLSRYDVIVTGVRAYERRPDLRANNSRLIGYVEKGGTLIVQYNKFEFNEAQYGPYPAEVSSSRVTEEYAPVEVLVPDHPLFNFPNKIGEAAWKDWVQERGLYFMGKRDSRYVDLVSIEEPFEYNKGKKTGALIEARVGKGRWIYVGLGLWRQLPAGTPGAYQLLANLLSVGKSGTAKLAPAR